MLQTDHIPRASVGRYRYRLARLVPRYIVFNIKKEVDILNRAKKIEKYQKAPLLLLLLLLRRMDGWMDGWSPPP